MGCKHRYDSRVSVIKIGRNGYVPQGSSDGEF
jgi:hypothetical protein